MKLLSNPDWLELVIDLSPEECKEILLCILDYPNRDSKLSAWRFMKKELARSTQKYQAKVDCMDKNRQKRWAPEQTETDSEQISDESVQTGNPPEVIDRKEKLDINNTNKKKEIDLLLRKTAKAFGPNAPKKHLIDDDFSFKKLANNDAEFQMFYMACSDSKLVQSEQSLKYKHMDEHFTTKQIIGWINNEGRYC